METDKEAIIEKLFINRWATLDMQSIQYFLKDGTISGYFRQALNEAMDTYASSLIKERDELKRDKLYWQLEAQAKHKQITQLQSTNEAKDKEIERLKGLIEEFTDLRKFFKKGSPLTEMMDKIIENIELKNQKEI